ncbi:MAG TPA: hypothetical protein VEG35_02175 [Burkholderiales bacterium]|nr:hypothetical protein [Burkholderiales bacterium]
MTLGVLLTGGLAIVAIIIGLRHRAAELRRGGLIVGAKIYEYSESLPALFAAWREAGINTAFVSPALQSRPEFRALAKANGIATFIIFPVFFDAEELALRPDLYAVTDKGARAEESWVRFVCPTRPEYRAVKTEALRKLVRETDPDGVSLDFIRFFVFWEMVYPDRTLESLPNTCFDASCLEDFRRVTGIAVPVELSAAPEAARWILANHRREWTEWKCGVIADTVRTLAAAAREVKSSVKVNLHAVPWRTEDFGGAGRIIAGQDPVRLAPLVDYISPMCYHHMVRRTPAWVHSVVEDMARTAKAPILPSIQVKEAYIPGPETPAEFRAALVEALRPPSRGVVFWNWPALAESPEKLAAVREVLRSGR